MRKSITAQLKAAVALEALKAEKTQVQIASEYEVPPNQVSAWKQGAQGVLVEAFSTPSSQPRLRFFGLLGAYLQKLVQNDKKFGHSHRFVRVAANLLASRDVVNRSL